MEGTLIHNLQIEMSSELDVHTHVETPIMPETPMPETHIDTYITDGTADANTCRVDEQPNTPITPTVPATPATPEDAQDQDLSQPLSVIIPPSNVAPSIHIMPQFTVDSNNIPLTFTDDQIKTIERIFDEKLEQLYTRISSETKDIKDKVHSQGISMKSNLTQIVKKVQKKIDDSSTSIKSSLKKELEGLNVKQILHKQTKDIPVVEYYQKIRDKPLIQKVLCMLRYVISTKNGIITCWPFKLRNNECVFVTNIQILTFVAKHLFKNDLKANDFKMLIPTLDMCQIETYLFEEREINSIRTMFPVEVKVPKGDKNVNWFGIRAEVLKVLFRQINPDCLRNIDTYKEWQQVGLKTKKDISTFPKWELTKRSRSNIYPTKSTTPVPGKIQWGVPMTMNFFTPYVYESFQKLGVHNPLRLRDKVHIGCGLVLLAREPVVDRVYPVFNVAPDKLPPKTRKRVFKKRKTKTQTVVESDSDDDTVVNTNDTSTTDTSNVNDVDKEENLDRVLNKRRRIMRPAVSIEELADPDSDHGTPPPPSQSTSTSIPTNFDMDMDMDVEDTSVRTIVPHNTNAVEDVVEDVDDVEEKDTPVDPSTSTISQPYLFHSLTGGKLSNKTPEMIAKRLALLNDSSSSDSEVETPV